MSPRLSLEPGEGCLWFGDGLAAGRRFPIHHDDGQSKRAGGAQLAICAAGILRHQDRDAVPLHQGAVVGFGEGAAPGEDVPRAAAAGPGPADRRCE